MNVAASCSMDIKWYHSFQKNVLAGITGRCHQGSQLVMWHAVQEKQHTTLACSHTADNSPNHLHPALLHIVVVAAWQLIHKTLHTFPARTLRCNKGPMLLATMVRRKDPLFSDQSSLSVQYPALICVWHVPITLHHQSCFRNSCKALWYR